MNAAIEMARANPTRWPDESSQYRQARTELLAREIELRRHIQDVAALRRALPPGPRARSYTFLNDAGTELGLADLFGRHDTLFTYFWMFGPEPRPIPGSIHTLRPIRCRCGPCSTGRPRAAARPGIRSSSTPARECDAGTTIRATVDACSESVPGCSFWARVTPAPGTFPASDGERWWNECCFPDG